MAVASTKGHLNGIPYLETECFVSGQYLCIRCTELNPYFFKLNF